MIQRHLTTNDADADTPSDQSLASEGAESEDICKGAGHPCSPISNPECRYLTVFSYQIPTISY